MHKNRIQLIHKGQVVKETDMLFHDIDREIKEGSKGSKIVYVNDEGTALMQVTHVFTHVGESIEQVKYSTSAKVSQSGTVIVTQYKQEVASRGDEVWYYKNSLGTFEGTLTDAVKAFPDVDFKDLKPSGELYIDDPDPELGLQMQNSKSVDWETLNEFDGEKEGGPTTWDEWADATQTALSIVGLLPVVGEAADCINGVISLARGNYGDAALSFAAMLPIFGSAATGANIMSKAKKLKKFVKPEDSKFVYDLIVRNGDDIHGYVGQSKNVFQRFIQHFNPKRGKLYESIVEEGSNIYKMAGSTTKERLIYEQYVILKRYKERWKETGFLLNKVNPVGGKFNLKTKEGLEEFYKAADKVIKKYDLPREFPPYLKN